MKLGLMSAALPRLSLEELAVWAKANGFDMLELACWPVGKADRRYADVPDADLPRSESLKDVLGRVMPYWDHVILPDLKAGKRVLIAAHGNSLRALLKYLEGVSDEDIVNVDLPTGIPKAYRLNSAFKADDARFLGDPQELERRINAVKAQTKRA